MKPLEDTTCAAIVSRFSRPSPEVYEAPTSDAWQGALPNCAHGGSDGVIVHCGDSRAGMHRVLRNAMCNRTEPGRKGRRHPTCSGNNQAAVRNCAIGSGMQIHVIQRGPVHKQTRR